MVQNPRWKAVAAMFAVIFLWSSSFVVAKHALSHYSPMVVTWGRMAIGVLGFLIFYPGWRKVKLAPGDLKWLVLMGLCEPCLYFILETHALKLTSASQAGAVSALYPPLTAVAAALILKEKLTPRTILGFGLAVTGAVGLSLAGSGTESAPRPVLGNFLEFLAMVSGALFTIGLKRLSSRYPGAFLALGALSVGFVFFTIPALFSLALNPPTFSPSAFLALLYLGFFVSMVALGLFGYALKHIRAAQAATWSNLMPVIALTLGWLVLGETMNPAQYLLAGLIILGVLISKESH